MKKRVMIGAGLLALVTAPVLAVQATDKPDRAMMGPKTRAEVEAKVAERFAMLDTNKDGAVTKAEADAHREAMRAKWQEKRAERRAAMFAKLDTDKNGQLSPAEFAARPARAEGDGKHDGRRGHHRKGGWMRHGLGGGDMFAMADANQDGQVTLAEAKTHALARFDKADTNKDGTLTPEERHEAWKAMREAWRAKEG